jgi:hypothetical protein
MKPKEKAKELFDKYLDSTNLYPSGAKKCALIAVDEIINHIRVNLGGGTHQGVFWLEVRKEIEVL